MSYNWNQMSERERDALVAEKVMGYIRHFDDFSYLWGWRRDENSWTSSFSPSTDIADAWQAIEKIISTKKSVDGQNVRWQMQILHNWEGSYIIELIEVISEREVSSDRYSFPEAICIAALRACGVEIET